MAVKQNFLDRFSERLEDLDANSRQAYILRLARERGFFETVFNAVEEGILVVDRRLKIRYFNRAARELLALGWMLSFNGAITFKNARRAPEVVAAVPLERLMIETDSPYLTPVPHRGERNDSSYVHFVAEKIAGIKGIPYEEVVRATTENGKRFFRIA